jgi:DNA polymerase III alpha subunit
MNYADLQVTTHFSFLRGASSPDELFVAAAGLGIAALGIVDRNSLAGMVRAHEAAKATGVRLIVGCRLDLQCGTSLLVYPTDRKAYGRVCRLLTLGKTRAGKGACHLDWPDVAAWSDGLIAVLLPDDIQAGLAGELATLRHIFEDRAYCGLTRRFLPDEALRLQDIAEAASGARVATVATNDIVYHCPTRRMLQDVVTCIRLHTTIDNAGFLKERHADRFLKAPDEILRLFPRYQDAVRRTCEIAERCRFSLDQLTYTYPTELLEDGLNAQERLEKLTWGGAARRYPEGLPDNVATQLRHELNLIERMQYAAYFLTVESIVRFARGKKILCQGRGSAANSAVCYVLGVTSIDPVRQGLLFERFVSEERREPPDIDVDFEHERREEVIQWIYETYGRTRSALTAVVSRYRSRGAVREAGKALGLPEDVTGSLAGMIWGWSKEGVAEKDVKELNLNLEDRRLRLTLELAKQLIGTPRHLSQHPGGFVLTLDRLDELVPVEPAAMPDRQVIEWDKDDIDALKFMKVDVLGLGMLGCMRRIVAMRVPRAYASVEDLWRRATVPVAALNGIARADGFRALGHSRREAAWAIKGLRDEALPLFAAADDRAGTLRPEATEPQVTLPPMTMGREVVEDYRSKGLSLRAHPLHFLRESLHERGFVPCRALAAAASGSRLSLAGLVLVRQMPGSAKGVMFVTLEDETANANLIVWPSVFEQHRRTILSSSMLGCRGKVQREGDVIHLIVEHARDLTNDLRRVSGLDAPFPLQAGRGDEAKHGGSGLDSRDARPPMIRPRDMCEPDLQIDTLKPKARNFR